MLTHLQRSVWVYMQAIDMRKGYDGLYGLIRSFHSSPLEGEIFLFLSGDRKKAKAIYFDGTGWVILSKRLEKGRFAPIFSRGKMSLSELSLFFEGSKSVTQKLSPADLSLIYRA